MGDKDHTRVVGAHAEGKAAHPGIELGLDRFASEIERRGIDPDTVLAPDLYLAIACERGDGQAIARFESVVIAPVEQALRRKERDPAVIDEILQRARVRALVADGESPPRLSSYSGRGSLIAWFKVMTLRLHADYHREARTTTPNGDGADVADPASTSAAIRLAAKELAPLARRALRVAVASLSPRDRFLFRLCYRDGASLDRIGALYGVHKSTVSRWLSSARDQVLERALAHARAQTGGTREELLQAFSDLQSRLDLSLSVFFTAGAGDPLPA